MVAKDSLPAYLGLGSLVHELRYCISFFLDLCRMIFLRKILESCTAAKVGLNVASVSEECLSLSSFAFFNCVLEDTLLVALPRRNLKAVYLP